MKLVKVNTNKILKGFTMVELLIVMTIIAVLSGLSFFALGGARESARDGRRKSDLENIRSALELYKSDCNEYPAAVTAGNPIQGSCPNAVTYIEEVPDDPLAGQDYSYVPSVAVPRLNYVLCTALETDTAPDGDCKGSCGTGTCSYHVANP